MIETKYDSRTETLLHMKRVNELMILCVNRLLERSSRHDQSKLQDQEKEIFDEYTPKLARSTYGSPEYMKFLQGMSEALKNHYCLNSHHPEHYKNGISDFTLFDLFEMFVDWKAASERHNNGCIFKSIEINKDIFKIDSQLVSILENTARALNFVEK